jgi:hypothetical protein
MTITIKPARNEYTATAGQTIFNYTFKIYANTDLNVYQTPSGDTPDDSTDLITSYTVTGVGDEDGGAITLNSGASANDLITIVSNIPTSRTTDYQNNGDFLPSVVNPDFDRVVSLVKQTEDVVNRSLVLPQSRQGGAPLDLPVPEGLKFVRWKADGSGMENVDATTSATIVVTNLSNYGTLQNAITQISTAETELWIDKNDTLTASVTSPSNIIVRPIKGFKITVGAFNWTYNGPTIQAGHFEWLDVSGAGFFLFGSDVRPEFSPIWIGAKGDGATDDGTKFFEPRYPGTIRVPYTEDGYLLGDGATASTNITPADNTVWKFDGAEILHDALNSDSQAQCFTIDGVSDVKIIGPVKVTGQGGARNGMTFRGSISRITVENFWTTDNGNFGIQYADTDTSKSFNELRLTDCRIDGNAGLVGVGSGFEIFPRSETGGTPDSKNLFLTRCYGDVDRGEASEANHGPQAFKMQAVDGVFVTDCFARGGDVGSFLVTNGAQNVKINGLTSEFANRGIQIDSDNTGGITSLTESVLLNSFTFRQKGIDGNKYAIVVKNSPKGVAASNFDIDGGFQIINTTTTDTLEGLRISNGRFDGSIFSMDDPGAVTTNVTGLIMDNMVFDSNASGTYQIQTGDQTNRQIDASTFSNITGLACFNTMIANVGSKNTFSNIVSIGGNPTNNASSSVIDDLGSDTVINEIVISGTNFHDWFFQKRTASANGLIVNGPLVGTPTDSLGMRITNQESNKAIQGSFHAQSPVIDLSGAAQAGPIFVASETIYLLSISFFYTEASSSDAGIGVVVEQLDGTNLMTHTSIVSATLGQQEIWQNTAGTRAFSIRRITAGDALMFTTAGGKTGVGELVIKIEGVRGVE